MLSRLAGRRLRVCKLTGVPQVTIDLTTVRWDLGKNPSPLQLFSLLFDKSLLEIHASSFFWIHHYAKKLGFAKRKEKER